MATIDVCNGDADGLFALVQLRLLDPAAARLVTGLKHDIDLLERVEPHTGDRITVLDVSFERNRRAVERALAAGAWVRYFDHHAAADLPHHPRLETFIDPSAATCTSLIVDRYVGARMHTWAIAGAYGDNLRATAERLAQQAGLGPRQRDALRRLGEAVNYNAYGEVESDVLIDPHALYALLVRHRDPLEAVAREPVIGALDRRRRAELQQARQIAPHAAGAGGAVFLLPDAGWSRRVLGPYANELAHGEPGRAHAVAKPLAGGGYAVSVRAPLRSPAGAERLCRQFGGGGRRAAAAIGCLPASALADFVAAFLANRWGLDDDPS